MARGISFDPAAGFYDRTRGLPPHVRDAVTELLARELDGRGGALEVGVGTGRISLPLAERGLPMAGVDLSHAMLWRLMENAGGRAPFPVAVADGVALPFASGAFGAIVICHVLHLVEDWRTFLAEAVRVVRPGGVVLFDSGSESPEIARLKERFAHEAGLGRVYTGIRDVERIDQEMAALGASRRILEPAIEFTERKSFGEFVRGYRRAQFSFTWAVRDPEILRKAAKATRAWVAGHHGDPDEPRDIVRTIRWRAYDVPG